MGWKRRWPERIPRPKVRPLSDEEREQILFGVPIDVLAEPRQWYIYHRRPQIVEVSKDRTGVLVEFASYSLSGPFSGTCLYVLRDGQWGAYTIKPNQSGDIETAIAWLEKRGWRAW